MSNLVIGKGIEFQMNVYFLPTELFGMKNSLEKVVVDRLMETDFQDIRDDLEEYYGDDYDSIDNWLSNASEEDLIRCISVNKDTIVFDEYESSECNFNLLAYLVDVIIDVSKICLYKVKRLCFDSNISCLPYEDNPKESFSSLNEAWDCILALATDEVKGLNSDCDDGVSFGIPNDIEFEKQMLCKVQYYRLESEFDTTGITEDVTYYWICKDGVINV